MNSEEIYELQKPEDPLHETPEQTWWNQPWNDHNIMVYLVVAKILLSFAIGVNTRYHEHKWWTDVFYQNNAVLGAVFTERQQHEMSSYDIRRRIFHGDILTKPFSKAGHLLFVLSLFTGYLVTFYITNEHVHNSFFIEKICLWVLFVELVVVTTFRVPILIMAHIPALCPLLHEMKKMEYEFNQFFFPRKVKIINVVK